VYFSKEALILHTKLVPRFAQKRNPECPYETLASIYQVIYTSSFDMVYSFVLSVCVFLYVKVKVTSSHAEAEVKRENFRNHGAISGWGCQPVCICVCVCVCVYRHQ